MATKKTSPTAARLLSRLKLNRRLPEPALPSGNAGGVPDATLFGGPAGAETPTPPPIPARPSRLVPQRGAVRGAAGAAGGAGAAGAAGAEYRPTINLNPNTPAFPGGARGRAGGRTSFQDFGRVPQVSVPTSQARPGSVMRTAAEFAPRAQPPVATPAPASMFPGLDAMTRDRSASMAMARPGSVVRTPADFAPRTSAPPATAAPPAPSMFPGLDQMTPSRNMVNPAAPRPGSIVRTPADFAPRSQPPAAPQAPASRFPGLDQMVPDRRAAAPAAAAAAPAPASETGSRRRSSTPMSALGVEILRSIVNPRIGLRRPVAESAPAPAPAAAPAAAAPAAPAADAPAAARTGVPFFADVAAPRPGAVVRTAADFAPRAQTAPVAAPNPDAALRQSEQQIANSPLFKAATAARAARSAAPAQPRGLVTRMLGGLFTGDVEGAQQRATQPPAAQAPIPANRAPAVPLRGPRATQSPVPLRGFLRNAAGATQATPAAASTFWFDGDTKTLKTGTPPAGYEETGVAQGDTAQPVPIFAKSTTTDAARSAAATTQQKAFADFQARKRLAAQASRTPGGMDMLRKMQEREARAAAMQASATPAAVERERFGQADANTAAMRSGATAAEQRTLDAAQSRDKLRRAKQLRDEAARREFAAQRIREGRA